MNQRKTANCHIRLAGNKKYLWHFCLMNDFNFYVIIKIVVKLVNYLHEWSCWKQV